MAGPNGRHAQRGEGWFDHRHFDAMGTGTAVAGRVSWQFATPLITMCNGSNCYGEGARRYRHGRCARRAEKEVRMSRLLIAILLASALSPAKATTLGSEVTPFVVVSALQVALRHVNVIDGTGALSRPDQTVIFID